MTCSRTLFLNPLIPRNPNPAYDSLDEIHADLLLLGILEREDKRSFDHGGVFAAMKRPFESKRFPLVIG